MFEQRLIFLVSVARFGVRCWVLGTCVVSGRSDRGSWGIVLSFSLLSFGNASTASHMSGGGTGDLWDSGIRLCLGS